MIVKILQVIYQNIFFGLPRLFNPPLVNCSKTLLGNCQRHIFGTESTTHQKLHTDDTARSRVFAPTLDIAPGMSFLFLIFLFLHSNVVIQLHSSCTSGSTLELVVESYNSLYFLRFCWGIIISIFFFYLGYETQQFTCKSCWCLKDW